jgi:hypothetical protein
LTVNDTLTKTCNKCGVCKPLEEFYSKGRRCRACSRACSAARYTANREKAAAQQAEYRAANREKVAAQQAEYRAANREKLAAKKAAYYASNREKLAAKKAAYYASNREKVVAYRVANREKKAARSAAYCDALAPCYVANRLGLPVTDLTPELLELARQRILNTRALRDLNATLKEQNHDE